MIGNVLGAISIRALEHYAEQVRQGTPDLYYYYRFYEQHFRLSHLADHEGLMRKATIRLFTSDPYAYATTFSFYALSLTEPELEQIASAITFGGDEAGARFLRGKLWTDAARHRENPEPLVQRGLEELEGVGSEARDHEFWSALADCYRVVDYDRYKGVIPHLLFTGSPEWRSHDLSSVLQEIARKRDWPAFDEWRPQWEELPQNAHICDCQVNELYTWDGLRAFEAGDVETVRALLHKATNVRGCSHLNTHGPRFDLVEALVARREILTECEAYLDFCDAFVGPGRTAKLRSQISSAGS